MTVSRYPSAFGQFSDSVAVDGPGRWIHVSGQVGFDEENHLVAGGMYEQTVAAIGQIDRALASAEASLADVVSITAYLTDLASYGEFSRAREDSFAGNVPASAAVGVADLLLGALVEIHAVAFVPREGG